MKLYSSNEHYKLYHGNMLDMLEVIQPNTIDSIITDPPYGLTSITKRFGNEKSAECKYGKDGSFQRLSKGFMGKEWDGSGIEYNIDAWRKCYEVLKPGGYLLAFGGSRTFHRIACAIEDAGFEIKDTIMWLYGQSMPKGMNIGLALDKRHGIDNRTGNVRTDGKGTDSGSNIYNSNNGSSNMTKEYEERVAQNKWKGWNTQLKPSYEPIIVARKPFKGTILDNIEKYGVGGINIDECRVRNETISIHNAPKGTFAGGEYGRGSDTSSYRDSTGRFPANTILTYDETDFDEVCGGFPYTKNGGQNETSHRENWFRQETTPTRFAGDSGSASRYFYCAKASKKDRDEGLEDFEEIILDIGDERPSGGSWERRTGKKPLPRKNIHPTVKPTDLMQYLVRLVTPNNGTILDPFNGSGSTGKAVMYENKERNKNYKYIGVELTEEYLPIAKARIEYVCNLTQEKLKEQQMTIFDYLESKGK